MIIFYGNHFGNTLRNTVSDVEKIIDQLFFGYYVLDPERFGVVGFDSKMNVTSIEEKPQNPKSNYAAVGLYYYTNSVIDIAKNIKPSKRES